MSWAFYVGAAIFALTVGGMFYMRGRPLRDARGNIVDEYGRPVNELSRDANVVLITLRNSAESLSSYDLRRHIDTTRQEFYAMIMDLEHRNYVTSEIVMIGATNVRRYLLTQRGHELFDDDQRAA